MLSITLLDETGLSIDVCGEDIDILDRFTYLGSVIYNNGGSRQEVLRWIGLVLPGLAHGVMEYEYLEFYIDVSSFSSQLHYFLPL